MQAVETEIREDRRFTITTLSLEFPDVSWSVVYTIVAEDLNFKKLCSRWVPACCRKPRPCSEQVPVPQTQSWRKHFSDNEKVKAAVNPWLFNQVADFFEEGFQNLILRYDKCIN
ncbi:hypothetical protein TNCV_1173671 [Trichonephila clavipes]|uniref:Uncharacterized protein n=1 Tax=Trichonephila clavipes TaxID=2585209 RepID=A0A8X6VES6_TRICX|nr:hypothetical protein TNCV_1173671 [Trichonephila clavipes]